MKRVTQTTQKKIPKQGPSVQWQTNKTKIKN